MLFNVNTIAFMLYANYGIFLWTIGSCKITTIFKATNGWS